MNPVEIRSRRPWSGLLHSTALVLSVAALCGGPAEAARRPGYLSRELSLAVGSRDRAAVRSLLARGADPNPAGQELPPLMSAGFTGDLEITRILLRHGADLNAENVMGNALTTAIVGGHAPVAKLLLARGSRLHSKRLDRITLLMMAAREGRMELLRPILARKQDLNAQDVSRMTALMHAASQGQTEVVRLLLRRGAGVGKADQEGFTALLHAARNGHAEAARLLLARGADPEARDRHGRTALLVAASYGDHPATVRVLRAAGAKDTARDKRGRTAGELAAARGYTASAALLPSKERVAAVPFSQAPAEAARKSLARIDSSMKTFTQRTGCASCHNEGFQRWTTGFARERGLKVDEETTKLQTQRVLGEIEGRKAVFLRALKDPQAMREVAGPFGDATPQFTSVLMGLAAHGQPATEGVTAATMVLAQMQTPDGSWRYDMPRGPMQSSHFTMTAMALRILATYGVGEHAPEVAQRTARAKAWLLTAPARSTEDRAFRLLGLQWAGASAGEREAAVRDLLATQRADGGWSQGGKLKSDAYATGQALFALNEGGEVAVTEPVYRRGVEFLLRTQDDTGTWYVSKRVMPGNFYFDTGFPYGQSQYISLAATGWASMALMLAGETSPPDRSASSGS